ncbi:MAG: hypothetical protein RL172_600 [Bacteroidota bacterium]|jgi:hypothetical protein
MTVKKVFSFINLMMIAVVLLGAFAACNDSATKAEAETATETPVTKPDSTKVIEDTASIRPVKTPTRQQ